jgi:hypothetical protein
MDDQLVLAAAPLVVLSFLLLVFSALDLVSRPASQVTGGRKAPWALVMLVGTVGPIAYLWFGRKPSRHD